MQKRHRHAAEEIGCRLAFDPAALAKAVQAMADADVMILGYTFEPHEDRGRARFLISDPTNAMLALEGLGLEPERVEESERETGGPWPDA